MKENKVSTKNSFGEKLVGIATTPDVVQEKYKTVILVHGFGVTKEEGGMFDELAEHLVDAGFLVYRFDFSGRGESEGDYVKTSLFKQRDDLSKILEFVKAQEHVDADNIGILAQSFGTPVTVSLKPKVKTIILMGSVAHPEEVIGKNTKWEEINKEGISKKVKPNGEVIHIGPQFWPDLAGLNLLEMMRDIRCPIFFIHGAEDERVPLSDMEEYFRVANEPKEKLVLEGALHSLRPKRAEMYKAAVDWFKKYL